MTPQPDLTAFTFHIRTAITVSVDVLLKYLFINVSGTSLTLQVYLLKRSIMKMMSLFARFSQLFHRKQKEKSKRHKFETEFVFSADLFQLRTIKDKDESFSRRIPWRSMWCNTTYDAGLSFLFSYNLHHSAHTDITCAPSSTALLIYNPEGRWENWQAPCFGKLCI